LSTRTFFHACQHPRLTRIPAGVSQQADQNCDAFSGRRQLGRYTRTNPEKLSVAIAGTGSVVVDLFKARSGVKFISVPFQGSSRAMIDLMSGQVKTGKLIPLAALALTPAAGGTTEMKAMVEGGTVRWQKLAKESSIKPAK
jgi:tripartite-type tricarboxylate transporter receptor subunit TctC